MGAKNRIARKVRICGTKKCRTVHAVIDTGASITTMTERLAKALGIAESIGRGEVTTAGGKVEAYGGIAKICLPDKGCGCLSGPVAVLPIKGFGDTDLLIGQDLLEGAGAVIDCAGRSLSCKPGLK